MRQPFEPVGKGNDPLAINRLVEERRVKVKASGLHIADNDEIAAVNQRLVVLGRHAIKLPIAERLDRGALRFKRIGHRLAKEIKMTVLGHHFKRTFDEAGAGVKNPVPDVGDMYSFECVHS